MRYLSVVFGAALLVIVGCQSSNSGEYKGATQGSYQSCTPCHNGRTAPDLRGRFSSADELVRAAKRVQNPLMANVKENEPLLRGAAKDLGLK